MSTVNRSTCEGEGVENPKKRGGLAKSPVSWMTGGKKGTQVF